MLEVYSLDNIFSPPLQLLIGFIDSAKLSCILILYKQDYGWNMVTIDDWSSANKMEHALFEQIRSNEQEHISVVFSICRNNVSSVSSSIKENKKIHINLLPAWQRNFWESDLIIRKLLIKILMEHKISMKVTQKAQLAPRLWALNLGKRMCS